MTIKMIAVDMDGTFLNDQKEYNVLRFNKLFKLLQERNIKFVVASGNQYFQLRTFFPDLYKSITFIAENGANILLGEKPFYNAELDYETALKTLDLLDKLQPTNLIVCGKNSAYVSENISDIAFTSAKFYYPKIKKIKNLYEIANEKDAIFKFAISFDEKNVYENLLLLQNSLENKLVPVSSGHGDIDLIIPGIHKLHGLKLLATKWNISDDEIATFGDSGNDIEMIQQLKNSFAMNNAQQSIKEAASTIIGSNNSEAVLDTIQSILEEQMFMMTMIEVTDELGLDFFFVELCVVDSVLLIKPLKGMIKTLNNEIPLEKVVLLENSGTRLSFEFKSKIYTIIDYGNGVLKHLEKKLSTI